MGGLRDMAMRLHPPPLFTVPGVCFIKSVDINLFFFGKPKTGTKLIGI